jgi:hypothetical protein
MGTDEIHQLLGEMLLSAGIAQQALARAKQSTDALERLGLIETAAKNVTVIVQAAQLACWRVKVTSAEITSDGPQIKALDPAT